MQTKQEKTPGSLSSMKMNRKLHRKADRKQVEANIKKQEIKHDWVMAQLRMEDIAQGAYAVESEY